MVVLVALFITFSPLLCYLKLNDIDIISTKNLIFCGVTIRCNKVVCNICVETGGLPTYIDKTDKTFSCCRGTARHCIF